MSTTMIQQHNVTGVTVSRMYFAPTPDSHGFYSTSIHIDTEHLGRLHVQMFSSTNLSIVGAEAPASLPVQRVAA